MERRCPPREVVKQDLQANLGSRVGRQAVGVKRLVDEWQDDSAAQRGHLKFDGHLVQVLNGPNAAADPAAIPDHRHWLVAECERRKHAIDGVLQLARNAVVVLRGDDQVRAGVSVLDLKREDYLKIKLSSKGSTLDRCCAVPIGKEHPVGLIADGAAVQTRLF